MTPPRAGGELGPGGFAPWLLRIARVLPLLVIAAAAWSCGSEDVTDIPRTPEFTQTSEDNVLENLLIAYRKREIEQYAKLLARDFQIVDDPATRDQLGIDFRSRTEDSLRTEAMFNSPRITDLEFTMHWKAHSARPCHFSPPRDNWTCLTINDVEFMVEYTAPGSGERTIYRVKDQPQQFFFRRGRTSPPAGPGDSLVYLVEWQESTPNALHFVPPEE